MPGDAVHKSFAAIGGKRSFELKEMPVGKVYFPPRSHVLWHPRGERAPDPKVVASIDEKGFLPARAPVVWRQVAVGGETTLDGTVLQQGEALCIVIYGSRRTKALYELQQQRRARGILKKHEELLLPVFFFSGSEGDALLLREEEDGDPLKEPHAPSVIAHTFRMAAKCGKTIGDMMHVAPRDYAKATVTAMLRWDELYPEVAKAFDDGFLKIDGREYTTFVNILAPLLDDVPRARQVEMFEHLTRDRKRSVGSARSFIRQWFEAERHDQDAEADENGHRPARAFAPALVSGAEGDPGLGVPDIEDDGLGAGDVVVGDSSADDEGSDAASGEANGEGEALTTRPRKAHLREETPRREPRAAAPVEATSKRTVRRLIEIVDSKPKPTKVEQGFAVGARCGLGREEAGAVVKVLGDLPRDMRVPILGVLYRLGVWGVAVQRLAEADGVAHLIDEVRGAKKSPAPSAKASAAKVPRGGKAARI